MRQTLRDAPRHRALVDNGFVKIPVLDDAEMASLRSQFERLRPADGFDPPGGTASNPTTYHCTFLDTDSSYKRAFHELIRERFEPVIESLFDNYVLLIGNAYVKQPGKGQFEVHQNWNLTDRLSDITVTIWLPLDDTRAENGTLMVVPGSHKLTRDIAYPRGGYYFSEFEDRIREDYLEPVEVRAGEAVFFDDSIIHGSDVNHSDAPRAALQVEAIPAESAPAVYFPRDDGDFDVLAAPARFYLETSQFEIDRWPDMFPALRTEKNRNHPMSEPEFKALLTTGRDARSELWNIR